MLALFTTKRFMFIDPVKGRYGLVRLFRHVSFTSTISVFVYLVFALYVFTSHANVKINKIQVFELSCIFQEYRDFSRASSASATPSSSSLLPRKPSPASSSSSSSAPPSSPTLRSPPPSVLLCVLPATAVCVAVAGAALLLVYDTAAFFHSRAETAVALAISWFTVGSPLLSLMGAGVRDGSGGVGDDGAGGAGRVGRGGRQEGGTTGGMLPSRGIFLAPCPSVVY